MTAPAPARPAGFRLARIKRVADTTARLRRVTLTVDGLAGFDCPLDTLGPHVHALIPRADMAEPEWPTVAPNGHAIYPPVERRPHVRTYSVRRLETARDELDLEFVLHGDEGVASRWAARAQPGDVVGLWRPHGRTIDRQPDRYVIAGDQTALPAIAFMLENLPATARGNVVIEVPDKAEEQSLARPAGMTLTWLHRGNAAPGTTTQLQDAVRDLRWSADERVFVWGGAEARAARAIRAHARREARVPREDLYVLNYWKRGMAEGSYDHGE